MKHHGVVDIAVGLSARSKSWKNEKWEWSALVKKLTTEYKTPETYKQYKSASKEERSKIKDVGGYVGGYLRGGRRKPENVVHRQLLTLDIDHAHMQFWSDFTLMFDNAAVLHATHSHSPDNPRLRLVVPLSREVTPDEYVAIARRLAGDLGIDLFDPTTFEVNRLMFWPSNSRDVDYYSEFQDGPWLDADELLGRYVDWTDSSEWPTAESEAVQMKDATARQADPEEKRGIVGAFCRAYSIEQAIEKFLSEVYAPAGDDRYTYLEGTTAAGLKVYEGKFAFSHHGSDPCSGKLCNAFDLVRIHKFGHLTDKQSFREMEEFARRDPEVKRIIASERFNEAKYDFAEGSESEEVPEEEDVEWVTELEVNSRGEYLSTATNLNIIFANDPNLSGKFRENTFDNKRYVFGSLPWRKVPSPPDLMKNVDYSGVRNYIETIYGITGNIKIDDALALEFDKYSFHPVREYLDGLKWDGVERVDRVLIDYLGAEDNIYTREAIRKTMVGAVARVFEPGIKFDLVLTLVGDQGTGKSTMVALLGKEWFSDTFMTVQGKEALEQIQGAWIIEIAELAGLRKAEVESIKHFISKQEDTFRPAYARTSETFRRQCIFIGTTNSRDFLRDPSGNRRFMPIEVNPARAKYNIFTEFEPVVDQLWAEAVQLYREGETLYLGKSAERIAWEEQAKHSEVDTRRGIINDWLDTPLPKNWDEWDLFKRRAYFEDPLSEKGTEIRDYVCIAELWCECLGKPKEDMTRYNTRSLNDIMRSLPGWEPVNSTRTFPIYGIQKYYVRKLD